jgi:hypothetical protein
MFGLQCRGAYAGLLKRLHMAEVEMEKAQREAWEAGRIKWRRLRSQHAMSTFVQRLQSVEFADPPQRLVLFGQLATDQSDAHSQVTSESARLH